MRACAASSLPEPFVSACAFNYDSFSWLVSHVAIPFVLMQSCERATPLGIYACAGERRDCVHIRTFRAVLVAVGLIGILYSVRYQSMYGINQCLCQSTVVDWHAHGAQICISLCAVGRADKLGWFLCRLAYLLVSSS